MGFIRRIGWVLVLLLLFVTPNITVAQIAKTHNYTQAGIAGSPTQTVLSGVNTASSNLIIVGLTSFGAVAAPTLTDNLGTTYGAGQIAASVDAPSSGPRLRIYYIYGSSVGTASHTFSCTTVGAGYSSIYVATYTGVLTTSNPLDQVATLSSTGILNPTATPTQDGELVFSMVTSSTNAAAPTISGSFTLLNANPFAGAASFLGATANLIQTTAASATPAFFYSGANSAAATFSIKRSATTNNGGAWYLLINR